MINSKLYKKIQELENFFLFSSVLFLPTQLGKHFWPSFSFVYSLRVDYLSPTVYFWDLLVLALWTVKLTLIFLKKEKFQIEAKVISLLLFFLLTQAASVLHADNPGASLVRLKDYFTPVLFALYLSGSDFSKVKKIFFSGILYSVIFTCLLSAAQFLRGSSLGFWILGERELDTASPLIAKFNFYDKIFLRPYGTFSHPNLLAGFLILTLPLLMTGLSPFLKGFKIMLGLLISLTVFISFSRPGLILAGVYIFVLFRKFWKILVILAVLTSPLVFVRFSSIFTYDSLALLRRQELSEYAVRFFSENPLFGIGLNNFINVLSSTEVLVGTSRFLQPVHNIFLLSLSETGIFGFLGFLLLLLSSIYSNIIKKTNLNMVFLGNLLVIIFLGLFDHYFLTLPQGQRLLFMMIGLSFMRKS